MALRDLVRSGRARWLVPAAALGVIVAGVGVGTTVAGAAPALAPRTPAELLASLAHAGAQPFSGTVVETADLGLPALPAAGSTSLSWQSLVSGSHTARVWYASPKQVRVSLIGDLAESDVVRNGRDVWLWSSRDNTVDHTVLPAGSTSAPDSTPPIDPRTAATRALALIGPTTAVTVDGTAQVAGRAAYELVLAPRSSSSLVAQVRLAVDSETSVPLRVQVFAKGYADPVFETAFTSISFDRPADSVFSFIPPPGAKVTESSVPAGSRHEATGGTPVAVPAAGMPSGATRPTVIGSGWTAVVELDGGSALLTGGTGPEAASLGALLRATTTVTGAFGSGQLLRTPLLSVLVLSDGRVLVGAVSPDLLEQVAGTR
ncbi:MAG TPA: hypothetical protein VLV82_04140 [Candidatus Angelobacter sp.]|nr:hypothetical protein [Candidatus Angelobacter sp.]